MTNEVAFWLITYILRIMESLLIILVGVLIVISLVILYFQLKAKPKQEDNPTEKIQEEIVKEHGYELVRHVHQLFVKPIKK